MIHLLISSNQTVESVESTSKQKKHDKSESFHNLYRKTINLTTWPAGFPETVRRVDATVVVMDFWCCFGVDLKVPTPPTPGPWQFATFPPPI